MKGELEEADFVHSIVEALEEILLMSTTTWKDDAEDGPRLFLWVHREDEEKFRRLKFCIECKEEKKISMRIFRL